MISIVSSYINNNIKSKIFVFGYKNLYKVDNIPFIVRKVNLSISTILIWTYYNTVKT